MAEPAGDGREFGLILAFDTNDPEFTRGFEAGQIWERLERAEPFECYLHPGNTEMVMRMCEAKGVKFSAEPCGEHWFWLKAGTS